MLHLDDWATREARERVLGVSSSRQSREIVIGNIRVM